MHSRLLLIIILAATVLAASEDDGPDSRGTRLAHAFPAVMGMPWSEARDVLQADGVMTFTLVEAASFTTPCGTVMGASLAPGSQFMPPGNEAIKVVVSLGACGGDGSPQAPYRVGCEADVVAINKELTAHYLLSADIYMHGEYGTSPVARLTDYDRGVYFGANFQGSLDGNGKRIVGLTIRENQGDYGAGLFGWLASSARIVNLGIEDCRISGCDIVGGLAGLSWGARIFNCYVTGAVVGERESGGLVGRAYGGSISECYSSVQVGGPGTCGGMAGTTMNTAITHCCFIGQVDVETGGMAGGIVGRELGTPVPSAVNGCFWDGETAGDLLAGPGNALSTAEMKREETFSVAGWEFIGSNGNGAGSIWRMSETSGYPELVRFSAAVPSLAEGDGTPEHPFLVGTVEDLGAIVHQRPGRHYRLTGDIDCSGIRWSRPPIPYFSGVIDGDGHSILNLDIRTQFASHTGLVGLLSHGGSIQNLGVVNCLVSDEGDLGAALGAAVGESQGSILRCFSTGSVTGGYYAGGLVGRNTRGRIAESYSTAQVQGEHSVGGLLGFAFYGKISNCYATGEVVATRFFSGGLIGVCSGNSSLISRSYSTGEVRGLVDGYAGGLIGGSNGQVLACFWDMDAAKMETSGGGMGRSGAQMVDRDTFIEAGWDFLQETENGLDSIWFMPASGPPILGWQEEVDLPTFTVVFDAGTDGRITVGKECQRVKAGGNAVAPEVIATEGLVFTGWDSSLIGITSDALVAALYERQGTGEADDPYKIYTPGDFSRMNEEPEACYALMADVSFGDRLFTKALVAPDVMGLDGHQGTPFSGVFDGRGKAVLGLRVDGNQNSYLGLFGSIGKSATIKNVELRDFEINGRNYLGALAGLCMSSRVIDCRVEAVVSGNNRVGGLTGGWFGGILLRVRVDGDVSGSSVVGGLAGSLEDAYVETCLADGKVSGGASYTGGLAGHVNRGGVYNSYAGQMEMKLVGAYMNGASAWNCYSQSCEWTAEEMRDVETFLEVGWDFVGETANGTSDIWRMSAETGYPELVCFTSGYHPHPLSGNGTAESPYLISTAVELGAVRHYSPGSHFRLAADISLSGMRWRSAVIPILEGRFDGNGHCIDGFFLTTGPFAGVVAFLEPGGEISNLRLIDSHVEGSFQAGTIAGKTTGGTLRNCSVTGKVRGISSTSGGGNVGGMTGSLRQGEIVDCSFEGRVTCPNWRIGGVVGACFDSVLTGNRLGGYVSGISEVGGIAGYLSQTLVFQCSGSGEVFAWGGYIGNIWMEWATGGVLGMADRSVVGECYWRGKVTGVVDVGGLCGSASMSDIANCHAEGNVTGKRGVGGLAGSVYGSVVHCLSVCTFGDNTQGGGLLGVLGGGPASVTSSFWDVDAAGTDYSAGGEGKTSHELLSVDTFTSAGWDFIGEENNGSEDIWRMPKTGPPLLAWAPFTVEFLPGPNSHIAGVQSTNVQVGGDALPPFVIPASGWVFMGWDTSLVNVQCHLVATALCRPVNPGEWTLSMCAESPAGTTILGLGMQTGATGDYDRQIDIPSDKNAPLSLFTWGRSETLLGDYRQLGSSAMFWLRVRADHGATILSWDATGLGEGQYLVLYEAEAPVENLAEINLFPQSVTVHGVQSNR